MSAKLLFAYGSLVNRASAARALGRRPIINDIVVADLVGYRLAWNSRQRIYADSLGAEIDAMFLNIEPDAQATVPGVLLAVSDEELRQVERREQGYALVDVSAAVRTAGATPSAPVTAFVSAPAAAGGDAFLLDEYVEKVRQGWREFGADWLAKFERSLPASPLPRIAGAYRFVDPAQRRLT